MSDDDPDVVLGSTEIHGGLQTQVAVLQAQVRLISYLLRSEYVTRHEFAPVKLIAFGFAAVVISTVLVAVLALIIRQT
jgi:hypothetical protein